MLLNLGVNFVEMRNISRGKKNCMENYKLKNKMKMRKINLKKFG